MPVLAASELSEFRCELLSADQLAALARGPLARDLPASDAARSLHRDVYLDTPDDALRRRGVVCRFRAHADGRASLSLRVGNGAAGDAALRTECTVSSTDPRPACVGDNAVARRLRGLVDPALLEPRIELEVDRLTRSTALDWLRRPRVRVHLDRVVVRRNGTAAMFYQLCAHRLRGEGNELTLLERTLEADHGLRRSSVATLERAELALKWARLEDVPHDLGASDHVHRAPLGLSGAAVPEFLNPELSLLAFQHRVLALAEDPATPLAERLRFVSIVAANIDEFFMVRMPAALAAAQTTLDDGDDGLTPAEQLAAIRDLVGALSARQSRAWRAVREALAETGVRICRWSDLSAAEQEELRDRFRADVHPLLTPFAMTLSPGHPLPRLGHLSLSLALVLRPRAGGSPKFAELDLPRDAPRFFAVGAASTRVWLPLEDLVRGNLDALYPDAEVEHASAFRITRTAELELDECVSDDLLDQVSRATARRGQGGAVRLEVERAMPHTLRALLLENVRRERGAGAAHDALGISDVEEIDGMIDLRAAAELRVPDHPSFRYPPFCARRPFGSAGTTFDAIRAGDILAHHPFDSFEHTVTRFIRDAAADRDVAAIKMTLYRIGTPSAIADALLEAAHAGKSVTVFVELTARFDEDVNIGWARALEAAGGHVVRGIIGYKNHAKVALVVRRERGSLQRYVHIGTGNYNARSGEQYTDLSLFTVRPEIADDVGALFNELTGMSEPPRHASRALLVAPTHLLPAVLELIDREAAHARAGRPARITAKFNGLSDPDVVRALYRAARDGVEIDLVVRGICTLRPGVPGKSDRIRVVSVVGRFLEHSRIYRFANGGDPRYFIGSADLRPRNLRRRVELLAPVTVPDHRARLDRILALYVDDRTGWQLTADGAYVSRGGGISAQTTLMMP
jgi:polyphosphate kinase